MTIKHEKNCPFEALWLDITSQNGCGDTETILICDTGLQYHDDNMASPVHKNIEFNFCPVCGAKHE